MRELVNLFEETSLQVEYIMEDGKVVAVSHPYWPFRIMRNGNQIALVDEETSEPFGVIDADQFNTVLISWLLIDDPELVDEAAKK